ncbi:MAG TPA: endonuclease/exonuclease/phosphatase family protein [Solirubrobacterales bacterium]
MINAHAIARRLPLPAIAAMLVIALLLPGGAAAKARAGISKAKAVNAPVAQSHGNGNHFQPAQSQGKGKIGKVMTRNLYIGGTEKPVFEIENFEQFLDATGELLNEVVANDFPTRAKGLAQEILQTKPDLVGLQEVANWQTTPLSPAATPFNHDYLELLLNELNKGKGKEGKGKPQYRVVVVQQEFDFEAPADMNGIAGDGPGGALADAEIMGRLTVHDVILARRGAGVRTWNASGDHYESLFSVPIPILGEPLVIPRGWTATDAKVRGSDSFRFVNTHLEASHPVVRLEQAEELAAGPAMSSLPVVLVGDLNSDDDTAVGPNTLAYNFLIGAGFANRSTDEPLSCCLDSSLLAEGAGGSVADFDHQVDHILTRDPDVIKLKNSLVTGLEPVNGFWNSDHAGVFSALWFRN